MGKKHDRRSRQESTRDAGVRGQRLEEIFREELNSILDCEIGDRDLEGSRVTVVELSRDGSRARIWVAVSNGGNGGNAPEPRDVESALARASGFLRSRLCEALPLKRMPELRFRYDPAALTSIET